MNLRMTLSWRKDLKLNAHGVTQGHMPPFRFTRQTFVTSGSRLKTCFDLGDVKLEKDIVTFNEEEEEDILVEEKPQIELVTVFLRDTCQRAIY